MKPFYDRSRHNPADRRFAGGEAAGKTGRQPPRDTHRAILAVGLIAVTGLVVDPDAAASIVTAAAAAISAIVRPGRQG